MALITYIAELNGSGLIEHVWVKQIDARFAVPFDPLKHDFAPDRPAEFVGSIRSAIEAWLSEHCVPGQFGTA